MRTWVSNVPTSGSSFLCASPGVAAFCMASIMAFSSGGAAALLASWAPRLAATPISAAKAVVRSACLIATSPLEARILCLGVSFGSEGRHESAQGTAHSGCDDGGLLDADGLQRLGPQPGLLEVPL